MKSEPIFCEFAVQNGLLSAQQMVEIYLSEIKSIPTFVQVVYEKKLLKVEDILQVVNLQSVTGSNFKTAAEELKLWSDELEQKINETIMKSKRKLSQIMIDDFGLDLNKIQDTISRFEKQISNEQKAVELEEPAQTNTKTEFNPTFNKVNPEVLSDFLEFLNEEKKLEIENSIMQIETSVKNNEIDERVNQVIKSLYRDLHTLKGAACFINAQCTEKLVHSLEEMINKVQKKGITSFDQNILLEFINKLFEGVDIIWGLRLNLSNNGSEEGYWNDEESQKKYLTILDGIPNINKQIS